MAKTTSNGHMFKRGDNYYLEIRHQGKRHVQSLKTSNRREAEKKRAEIASLYASKSIVELSAKVSDAKRFTTSKKMPLDELLGAYHSQPAKLANSRASAEADRIAFNQFLKWVSATYPNISDAGEVDTGTASEYVAYLQKDGHHVNTVRRRAQHVKTIFRWLVKTKVLTENPFEIDLPKADDTDRAKRALTPEELDRVFAVFDSPKKDIPHIEEVKTMFTIGRYTGLRLGDCACLEWESVNMENALITVRTRKTKTMVQIPIHPNLYNELCIALRRQDQSGYVVPNCRRIYEQTRIMSDINRAVFDYADICTEIRGKATRKRPIVIVGFHSLRYTFISECANSGVPLQVASALVGHASAKQNLHYSQIETATLRKAIETAQGARPVRALPAAPDIREQVRKWAQTARLDDGDRKELEEIIG